MLPTKKKKPSQWRGFISFSERINRPPPRDSKEDMTYWIFDDKQATAKVLLDLDKLNVKRRRTFTGTITMSEAGIPKNNLVLTLAFKIGIALFISFDIFLVVYLMRLILS